MEKLKHPNDPIYNEWDIYDKVNEIIDWINEESEKRKRMDTLIERIMIDDGK